MDKLQQVTRAGWEAGSCGLRSSAGCYSENPPGWEGNSVVCHALFLVWATGFLLDGAYSRAGTGVSQKLKPLAG